MRKLLTDIHHALLVVTEDYPWWLRPIVYVGWWISLIPKLPIMLAYIGDDEGNQNYPGS